MRDHVQNVVFDEIRMHLEQDGETDERLEAFGTFQRRLHQSGHQRIGLSLTLSHSLIIRAGSVLGTGCTEGSVQNAASTASPSRRARSARCSAPTCRRDGTQPGSPVSVLHTKMRVARTHGVRTSNGVGETVILRENSDLLACVTRVRI